ncbi:LANO_0G02168g1_1 [Lachancea nothofagi CBS 11611]|uniref:LANO_0G02168g1_1 n=1 Tax=Lachancea nothofagi CBS 11611 TaxID=1266666 RepID=A0A1G4KF65_9SACH|nr:LANO_0G02168g1_1 [Lachancea nothofagi CBS 11611]
MSRSEEQETFLDGNSSRDRKGSDVDAFELSSFDREVKLKTYEQSEDLNLDDDNFTDTLLHEDRSKSSIFMAFMNMANSILGAGVIGQPFAVKNCGLMGGVLAIVLLSVLVDWTIRLIVVNMKISGKTSYQDTVEFAMGKKGKLLILLTNGLFAFGGCIGFCIIIGDTLPHVLRAFFPAHGSLFHRNVIILFVTCFVSFPLSLNRDISKLSKTSMLALVSMVVIVVIVLIKGLLIDAAYKGNLDTGSLFFTSRIFQGISVISFALVCHHNTTFIYLSLKNPSLKRFGRLTHFSCFIAMVFCFVMGYTGFLVFKNKTKGNILNNFPGNDHVINVARFCFGFNMLTTFPLEIFVLRDVIRDLIYFNTPTSNDQPIALSLKLHFIITSITVFSTMVISFTTCNLGALFELIGATTASLMAYILPPSVNLILTGAKKTRRQKIPHYACIFFGFAIMTVSSTQTIVGSIKNVDQKHCEV